MNLQYQTRRYSENFPHNDWWHSDATCGYIMRPYARFIKLQQKRVNAAINLSYWRLLRWLRESMNNLNNCNLLQSQINLGFPPKKSQVESHSKLNPFLVLELKGKLRKSAASLAPPNSSSVFYEASSIFPMISHFTPQEIDLNNFIWIHFHFCLDFHFKLKPSRLRLQMERCHSARSNSKTRNYLE